MFNYNVNKIMYDDKDTFDNLAKQYIADLVVLYDRNRFFLALGEEEIKECFDDFENNETKENLKFKIRLSYNKFNKVDIYFRRYTYKNTLFHIND
ncbi:MULTISPECIES: hypothetical protein [unclassified Mammaliicoccus]|uniref:hypothetical protein n=1 Tax=unclassified Mammaliicoccus TaxID=2803851 RepID=UPI001EFADCDB|nr:MULTISPECIES: hypothetical protein [unclassified Mammaliicoccus]